MGKRCLPWVLLLSALCLAGCGGAEKSSTGIPVVYGVMVFLSALLLAGSLSVSGKRELWFSTLFAATLVVNTGYFLLSVSGDLEEALWANRVAYFGSVLLPLTMYIIILRIAGVAYGKWLPGFLLGIAGVIFFLAASPGYWDGYYKEVFFERENGVSSLHKVYGPLHWVYYVYLLGYFGVMVITVLRIALKRKLENWIYAAVLAGAVLVNIGVWLIGQTVDMEFEFLSVSYLISEGFLLGLRLLMRESERQKTRWMEQTLSELSSVPAALSPEEEAAVELFRKGLSTLTPREREIYDCHIEGVSSAQIMERLSIKENTLKFHNKNIYGKLGVSSRKQLRELQKRISPG